MHESAITLITRHGHHQSIDAIQNYARYLDPGTGQCLTTQPAVAAPSRILPPYPQVWIHAAQPSGLSRKRRTTARPPLARAKLRIRSTAYIIQTSVPSAAPRLGMLRNLYRLLASPSSHTIYRRRARAGVINYWRQVRRRRAAHSVPPDHPQRKNEEKRPITARACHMVPVGICAKPNCIFEKCAKWSLNNYRG
jgi:hypothetical protein